jgi:hypothetical protein
LAALRNPTTRDLEPLRVWLGVSQAEFVEGLATSGQAWSRQTHSDIENGNITLSSEDVEKIRTAWLPKRAGAAELTTA